MPLTKDERRKLDETHETVNEVKQALVGIDGKAGLLDAFKELATSHYRLRKNFYVLVAFLAGSGVLCGGILKLAGLF